MSKSGSKVFWTLTELNATANNLGADIRWVYTRGPQGRGVYSYDCNGDGSLSPWGGDTKAAIKDIKIFLDALYIKREITGRKP